MLTISFISIGFVALTFVVELLSESDKRYDQTSAVHRYYLQAANIEKRREIARIFFNKNYPTRFN